MTPLRLRAAAVKFIRTFNNTTRPEFSNQYQFTFYATHFAARRILKTLDDIGIAYNDHSFFADGELFERKITVNTRNLSTPEARTDAIAELGGRAIDQAAAK